MQHEQALRSAGYAMVCGVDEVGRGPLAGPVCAAAVVLPADFSHPVLNDSKKLSERQRERIYEELAAHEGIRWAVALLEPEDIDRMNILQASREAMRRAVRLLGGGLDAALVDGLPVPDFPLHHVALVKGDSLSLSIAAASVMAKVTRDRLMADLAQRYPDYGFDAHKGYPTAAHLAALRQRGPCPAHRRSFGPVSAQALLFDMDGPGLEPGGDRPAGRGTSHPMAAQERHADPASEPRKPPRRRGRHRLP
jgi:ribonuclease HII